MIRKRLARVAVWVFAFAAACWAGAAERTDLDENLVALFSDTHVTPDPKTKHQREGLSRCVAEVLALSPRPATVLLYGDLAVNVGETNDYRTLKELLQPLEAAGVRWRACMGNHDRRAAYSSVFPERQAESQVPGRIASLVETPHAGFVLLDSTREGPVSGEVDDAQRAWLAQALSGRAKPVFVGAHHPLGETGVAGVMAASACCKAYLHGHDHTWRQQRVQGGETLCLPSTGHWGDIGYVLVRLSPDEAVFTIRQWDCYAPRPAAKPEDVKPQWKEHVKKNDGSQWRVPLK